MLLRARRADRASVLVGHHRGASRRVSLLSQEAELSLILVAARKRLPLAVDLVPRGEVFVPPLVLIGEAALHDVLRRQQRLHLTRGLVICQLACGRDDLVRVRLTRVERLDGRPAIEVELVTVSIVIAVKIFGMGMDTGRWLLRSLLSVPLFSPQVIFLSHE